MNHDLLPYYERELIFIRKMAAEFAEEYPDRASALRLSRNECDDPHVERMMEGFALLAGRIQHRLDQEFPEITGSLLELLYPHLIRPVPSMAIVQFSVDPELSKQREGQLIPRGSMVCSRAIHNVQCRFCSAYDVRLWPIEVSGATCGKSADLVAGAGDQKAGFAVRLELRLLGANKLSDFNIKELRFRIGGDAQAAYWIYEALRTRLRRVMVRLLAGPGKPDHAARRDFTSLPPEAVRPVGFDREEALLPVAETSFQGYRLLQEYFAYPQKFLFFDLSGLDQLPRESVGDRMEIVFLMDAIEQPDRARLLETTTNQDTFQLGCTPVINLFSRTAEPIRVSHTRTEYEVIPDIYSTSAFEVYSVDRVVSVEPDIAEPREYRLFYSFGRESTGSSARDPEAFWFGMRRASRRTGDAGSDYFLSFVNRNFSVCRPAHESMTVHATCSNRDLPAAITTKGTWGEMDLESGPLVRSRVLDGPTRVIRSDLSGNLQWHLISHLSLNHLSLLEGGPEALREILRLYSPAQTRAPAGQIAGIASVRSSRKIARLDSQNGSVFCPGLAIDLEVDEDRFVGSGAYLLASILERFFALYCTINSFTQLRVTSRQQRGVTWQWPIRSGEQVVV